MSQAAAAVPVCHSVFRKNAPTTTTEQYTQAWAALINRVEKNKEVLAQPRGLL